MEVLKVRIILSLEAEEARWLKGVMQNPMTVDGNPELEDQYDSKMRHKFFELLDSNI